MKNHKVAFAFLVVMNVINIIAGVITQLTLLFGWDILSVIPVVNMGTQQILYINFLSIYVAVMMICVIVALLVLPTFSISDIFTDISLIALIIPILLFLLSIYTSMGADTTSEKVICLIISAGFILSNVVSFGALNEVKDDE